MSRYLYCHPFYPDHFSRKKVDWKPFISLMQYVFLFLLVYLLLFGPQYWASYTFKKHATPLDRLKGTGGELARHLLDRFGMADVEVEKTRPRGEHDVSDRPD